MRGFEFTSDLHFCYDPKQRARFIAGELGEHWAKRYPEIFDKDDLRIYRNQCEDGYHFYEWLGAILLYEVTGYLSLVEKYGCKSHPGKDLVYKKLAPDTVQEMDFSGWPDLFCYAPDQTDWHFCEAKGKGDKLGDEQIHTFKKLYKDTGKHVCVLWLKEMKL